MERFQKFMIWLSSMILIKRYGLAGSEHKELKDFVNTFLPSFNVILSDKLMDNVLVMPVRKTIFIGNNMPDILNPRELKAILFHEIAHVLKGHVEAMARKGFSKPLFKLQLAWIVITISMMIVLYMSITRLIGKMITTDDEKKHRNLMIMFITSFVIFQLFYISMTVKMVKETRSLGKELMNLSRNNELEADKLVGELGFAMDLINGLKKFVKNIDGPETGSHPNLRTRMNNLKVGE